MNFPTRIVLFVTVCGIVALPAHCQEGTWEVLPDVVKGPVQEHGVGLVDGKIYTVGGMNSTLAIFDDVRVYDIENEEWSVGEPLPKPVHHANVIGAGGALYMLGALQNISFAEIGSVYKYDPASGGGWEELPEMAADEARGASAVALLDDDIYIIGGFRKSNAVQLVSRFNIESEEWTHGLAPVPQPLDHVYGGAIDGKIYVAGGRNKSIEANSDRLYVYDVEKDEWERLPDMAQKRGGFGGSVVDGKLYVGGGEGNPESPVGIIDSMEVYDPVSNEWTSLEPMRVARHGMQAVGHEGKMYVPGGATKQALGAVSTFDAFVPEV